MLISIMLFDLLTLLVFVLLAISLGSAYNSRRIDEETFTRQIWTLTAWFVVVLVVVDSVAGWLLLHM